ncbi:Mannosyl-oligosaccharide 1,2-alpha-mannosidase IA [Clydaea vesicula]|uniref:alpha-1,2-Mannosidase n=1 Tax=Clydaea vesicula TaxID=447962 RepID=A0AAD5TZ48_9FUNG|nr:Mannosyl-oligosaccharide 1,2-alpha-mannosidase IA [Clydaea vesicula]
MHAFGYDYLEPETKTGKNMYKDTLAATIIDSLDTLYLMNLKKEFNFALTFVKSLNNSFFERELTVSFFETVIRIVGGLIGAYELSNEKILIDTAVNLADRLLPAFVTLTNLPENSINLLTGMKATFPFSKGNLAEVGSNILEFTRLSQITGDKKYEIASRKALTYLETVIGPLSKVKGLYPVDIFVHDDKPILNYERYSLGGCSDSFYEYLLKMSVLTKGKDMQSKKMFTEAISQIKAYLINKNEEGLMYVSVFQPRNNYDDDGISISFYNNKKLIKGYRETKMEHLSCFVGGFFALSVMSGNSENITEDTTIAAGITETCYQMYKRQPTGLSPESVDMNSIKLDSQDGESYLQRPEALESIYYMWKLTKNKKYRNWAWEIALSIEEYTKCESGGYSGLKATFKVLEKEFKNNLQDSFFLAETLKYLYLIFDDDNIISLENFVFNTELFTGDYKDMLKEKNVIMMCNHQEFVFLKRKWDLDKIGYANTLRRAIDDNFPLWFLIFPEGTVVCEETVLTSQAYAKKMDWKYNPKHVLNPKSTGLYHACEILNKSVDYMYDLTMAFSDISSETYPYDFFSLPKCFFKGEGPNQIFIHCKKHKIDLIPGFKEKKPALDFLNEGEEKKLTTEELELFQNKKRGELFGEWVRDQFKTKDEMLKKFYLTKELKLLNESEKSTLICKMEPRVKDYVTVTTAFVLAISLSYSFFKFLYYLIKFFFFKS